MTQLLSLLFRLPLFCLFLASLWLPAWWLAGRIDSKTSTSLLRFPVSVGLALVGYITAVNLLGTLLSNSVQAALLWLALSLVASAALLWKQRPQLSIQHLWTAKRSWLAPLLLAVVLALPQWYQAVSGPLWDEIASSAIHVTAANQFADGVFPPRHNAFPDVTIKYHYGFTLLSGTVHWVTGLSSNVSIDVASTGLWLFTFLFTFFWLLQLGMNRLAATWGSFAVLLGGGLSWLYLPRLEVYSGFRKAPPASTLIHSYDSGESWVSNLITVMRNQSVYVRGSEGDLAPLPFDVAIHYQQHAVALGIALTLMAAYLFWVWQTARRSDPLVFFCSVLCFGLVFLGHAVFGGVASLSAGLVLVMLWLRRPSRTRFLQTVVFTIGVTLVAFLHGGMMSQGSDYGSGAVLRLRDGFGFIAGGFVDQMHWSLAGFGLPLLFAILSGWTWFRTRQSVPPQRTLFLAFFGVFGLVSFVIPQLSYFSQGTGLEEQTEVMKFFFCTHLAIAILSAIGVAYLSDRVPSWVFPPAFAITAIGPIAACIAGATNPDGSWVGFYKSPYDWSGGVNHMAMGRALEGLKKSNRDVYFDFSMDERRSGFLSELLVYGGGVSTLSPSRYEVTGFGFLLAEDLVAERLRLESRVARLMPGAVEDAGCDWIYIVPEEDLPLRPAVVRSRFAKMVAEGTLSKKFEAGPMALYAVEKATLDLDQGIERYWTPKVISQAYSDWDGDGMNDLIFFDYQDRSLLIGEERVTLPSGAATDEEFPLLLLAKLPGDERVDLVLGRMSDVFYSIGETIADMRLHHSFHWVRRDSLEDRWQGDVQQWASWGPPIDVPLIADHDHDGFDSHLVYRGQTGEWFQHPNQTIDGPSVPESQRALPVAGRFLPGSTGDLALWSPLTGEFTVQSVQDGATETMSWGGRPGDILLPGDYDGDGYDEVGVWQPHTNTWWVRAMPSGPNLHFTFGTSSSIPLPADYDDDGRLDLAYWEPAEQRIYVSFDFGQSVGRTISVPPHSIPAFVHMY